MNLEECIHPTDLQNQTAACVNCEKLNNCTMVGLSKLPAIKYKLLGKITYSNIHRFIGKFLEISENNYNLIVKEMNSKIKNRDFEKHLNDFNYHIFENINNEYELVIMYDLLVTFTFKLYYDSKYPKQFPINIFEKEILR
jgi:hypothetical protein